MINSQQLCYGSQDFVYPFLLQLTMFFPYIFTAHEISLGVSFSTARDRVCLQEIRRGKTEAPSRVSEAGGPDSTEGMHRI